MEWREKEDGNSMAGAKMLDQYFNQNQGHGISNSTMNAIIPAAVSDGEYIVKRHVISKMNDGDEKKGIKELYNLIDKIRKEKRGGKVSLPPKTKALTKYMGL